MGRDRRVKLESAKGMRMPHWEIASRLSLPDG